MIFIDTGAFVARHLQRDRYHTDSVRFWRHLARSGERCLTSNFVIDETLTLLGRRAGYGFAASVGRSLFASQALEILRPGSEDEIVALSLLENTAIETAGGRICRHESDALPAPPALRLPPRRAALQ